MERIKDISHHPSPEAWQKKIPKKQRCWNGGRENMTHTFFYFMNYFQRDENNGEEKRNTFFVILLFISGICVCLFIFPEKKKFEWGASLASAWFISGVGFILNWKDSNGGNTGSFLKSDGPQSSGRGRSKSWEIRVGGGNGRTWTCSFIRSYIRTKRRRKREKKETLFFWEKIKRRCVGWCHDWE